MFGARGVMEWRKPAARCPLGITRSGGGGSKAVITISPSFSEKFAQSTKEKEERRGRNFGTLSC